MYYTISQMAEMFGVTEHTLRFYTDKGLLPCERDGGNRRVFNEESVNWMQGIKCLKGCGASIEDIQEYCRLCLAEESEENLRARYAIIRKQREDAYKRIEEAKTTAKYMDEKVRTMKPFWQGLPRMIPIRKTGQKRTGQSTDCRITGVRKTMKLYEVKDRSQPLLNVLLEIWEQSVRATHLFLLDAEVNGIKAYVPQALKSVEHLIVAETEQPIGFMGVQNGRLEMLFLAPEKRGKGFGKQMLQYGIETYGITELTVNEQNPQAVGFYEHMGFETYKRTELDEEGDPYPLLYMKRVR